MDISKKEKLLLRHFNITRSVQIKLQKIKVPTARAYLQLPLHAHEKSRFKCHECDYTYFSKESFNNHQRIHQSGKQTTKVCPVSKKELLLIGDYRHRKIFQLKPTANEKTRVTKPKQFKCQICAYATVAKSHLKRHLVTHTDEKPFQCTLCSQSLKTRDCLKQHQLRHSDKNKKFHCPICQKLFHTKSEVNLHIPTHTREKPAICQFCESGFRHNGGLKAHVKVCKENPRQMDKDWVEKMKKYKCHSCSFSSVTNGQLTRHFKTHTGEKPFHCGLCKFQCSTKSSLNDHVRAHTGEKPFKCSQCTYRTANCSSLACHFKRRHAEPRQKDRICCHCSKRYYSNADLSRHIKLQHGK